jgi:hypothetical protein
MSALRGLDQAVEFQASEEAVAKGNPATFAALLLVG